jgi:hypothetical protein
MPPARFQVRDPFGVNTLNNGEFWRALTAEAGAVSMSAGGRQETSRVRENVTHTFLVTSMAFLLRPLAGVEVTATNAGLMGVDGLDGDALRVVGPQGLDVTFVFDRHDGHLVGYADQGRLAVTGEAPVLVHAVSRVSDFRLVGGLRFPHRIELSVPTGSQTGPLISVTEVEKIEIDTLTPADFSRDSGVGIGR